MTALAVYELSDYEPGRLPLPPTPPPGVPADPSPPRPRSPRAPAPPPVPLPLPDRNRRGPAMALLRRLLGTVLEVLDGRRSASQLQGVLDPRVYASLLTRVRLHAGARHRLHSLHTCQPRPDAIEWCATVLVSGKHRAIFAMAGRMERHGQTWRCTTLRPL